MENIEPEFLLGKHFSLINDFFSSNLKVRERGDGFYINSEFLDGVFYTMPYNFITSLADETKKTRSITIHFQGVINREFYDTFNKVYGKPNNIQVIKNRQLVSESFVKDDNGKIIEHLKKNTFDLREGTFEEGPLFIVWKKEGFQIKALLKHRDKRSEITFKKTN